MPRTIDFHGALRAMLHEVQERARTMPCRFMPTSFDPEDPGLAAFPRPYAWRWTSCGRMLRHFGAKAVLMQLPLFWQLSTPLHFVCRDLGVPFYPNEPENFPIGRAALSPAAGADVVIIEARDAEAFASYLADKGAPLPSWIIVHRAEAAWELPAAIAASKSRAAQEVHIMPGVPVLEQCEALADAQSHLFHASEDFSLDMEPSGTRISSTDPLFPFERLVLPFTLREQTACTCGRALLERV